MRESYRLHLKRIDTRLLAAGRAEGLEDARVDVETDASRHQHRAHAPRQGHACRQSPAVTASGVRCPVALAMRARALRRPPGAFVLQAQIVAPLIFLIVDDLQALERLQLLPCGQLDRQRRRGEGGKGARRL